MIKKDPSIIALITLINDTFGDDSPKIMDHWEGDSMATGIQKGDKLFYICRYSGPCPYFYECEFLLDDPDRPYISGKSDSVNLEELLNVISTFFEIKRKDKKEPRLF